VHTGVHYPSDAVIGSIIGAGVAEVVARPSGRVVNAALAGSASAHSVSCGT
jgi:membrane-associated phospholipid phosphatase